MIEADAITRDGFLGGRLTILQPRDGYRAGMDPVLLAAAVPAVAGESALELGCGTGVAALCLAFRVAGVRVTGVEIQGEYARLARESAALNGLSLDVVEGDATALPAPVRARSFDHVFANPPYFETKSFTEPASPGRARAHAHGDGALEAWIVSGRRRLRPGGCMTLVHRSAALPEILRAMGARFGEIEVIPIASRQERPADRLIVRARKERRGPLVLHPPLIMHDGPLHGADGDDTSAAARAILAEGASLR